MTSKSLSTSSDKTNKRNSVLIAPITSMIIIISDVKEFADDLKTYLSYYFYDNNCKPVIIVQNNFMKSLKQYKTIKNIAMISIINGYTRDLHNTVNSIISTSDLQNEIIGTIRNQGAIVYGKNIPTTDNNTNINQFRPISKIKRTLSKNNLGLAWGPREGSIDSQSLGSIDTHNIYKINKFIFIVGYPPDDDWLLNQLKKEISLVEGIEYFSYFDEPTQQQLQAVSDCL